MQILQRASFSATTNAHPASLPKGGNLWLRAFEIARRRVPNARLRLLPRDPIPAGFSLENVSLRVRLGRAARVYTQANFTWDKVVERMKPVIELIMSSKEERH